MFHTGWEDGFEDARRRHAREGRAQLSGAALTALDALGAYGAGYVSGWEQGARYAQNGGAR